MASHDSPRALSDLRSGDHVCFIYQTEQVHREVLARFLQDGLRRGERVLYMAHTHTLAGIIDYLAKAVNVGSLLAKGQLQLVETTTTYLREGRFDAARMIESIRAEVARAQRDGYPALRATGEMSWALADPQHLAGLSEYEALVDDALKSLQGIACCQYYRPSFSTDLLAEMLMTHPLVAVDGVAHASSYYLPKDQFLQPSVRAATRMALQRALDATPQLSDAAPSTFDELVPRLLSPPFPRTPAT